MEIRVWEEKVVFLLVILKFKVGWRVGCDGRRDYGRNDGLVGEDWGLLVIGGGII